MKKLYLKYIEYNEIISENLEENEPYSSYCEEQKIFSPKLLLKEELSFDYNSGPEIINVTDELYDLSHIYLVIVRYTDGGTFGQTHGCWEVIETTKCYKEAEIIKKSIEEKTYMSKQYMPWNGYFKSLDNVEIHRMEIIQE